MSKANKAVVIISIIIIFSVLVGFPVTMFILKKHNAKSSSDSETSGSNIDTDEHQSETVIEFEEGNEIYFDESLSGYLSILEKGTPKTDDKGNYLLDEYGYVIYENSYEEEFESIMDNLILLINKMAKEEFSMDASKQVQRFYVKYFDRFENMEFDDLFCKLKYCFLRSGASKEYLALKVEEAFGFNSGDDYTFVFSPFETAEISVNFYNVLPKKVEISEELKSLSIYESWKNPVDEEYERNLNDWLDSVIKAVKDANLSDEKCKIAQVLYAGTLADAEYKESWMESLIRCLTIEDFTYDGLKREVKKEFNVSIDYNESIKEFFQGGRA